MTLRMSVNVSDMRSRKEQLDWTLQLDPGGNEVRLKGWSGATEIGGTICLVRDDGTVEFRAARARELGLSPTVVE